MRSSWAPLVVLLTKFAKLVLPIFAKAGSALAKLAKGMGTAKVVLGVGSFGAYAVLIDWRFAVALLACVGIHESGHVWAMRRMGMATRGFYFIPFFGGMAVNDSAFPSPRAHAYVALMGPIWGLGTAFVTHLLFLGTGNRVFEVAACWMAFVNCLNLLPIHPLDGGRVLHAIGQGLRGVVGVTIAAIVSVVGMYVCIAQGYYLFGFFGLMGLMEQAGTVWQRWRPRPLSTWDSKRRAELDTFFRQLARVMGLPEDARLDAIQVALARLRKQPQWRADLRAFQALRTRFAKWQREWTRWSRRLEERDHLRVRLSARFLLDPAAVQCFRGVTEYVDALPVSAMGDEMQWYPPEAESQDAHFTFLPLDVRPPSARTCAAFARIVAEFRAMIGEVQELLPKIEERCASMLPALDFARAEFPAPATREQEQMPEALREQYRALPKLLAYLDGHPSGLGASIFWGRMFPELRSEWFAQFGFQFLSVVMDPHELTPITNEYLRLHATDADQAMPNGQLLGVIGAYVLLVVTLFALMQATGGHEAAAGAATFFREF